MKKVIFILIVCHTAIICDAHGHTYSSSSHQDPPESDSTVVFFARKIHAALAEKNKYVLLKDKETKRLPERKPARRKPKQTMIAGTDPPVPWMSIGGITDPDHLGVMMYPGPRSVPADSLYRFQMGDLDSLNVIFRSPREIASSHFGGSKDWIILFLQGKVYRKGEMDLLKMYGTDRYKERPWKNDRGADSTLLLFVEDIYSILEEENVRRRGLGHKALDLRRQVVIDNKMVDISDLDQYSIFDIAYMTIRFRRPKRRLFRARPQSGVVFLTTYKSK